MSQYYEPQGWQAPVRQSSWEQPVPPSRSGTSSVSQRDETSAFSAQFDEVDRAIDNLVKSGKLFSAPRRDSMPMMGPRFPDYGMSPKKGHEPARSRSNQGFQDPRMMGVSQRHHSISDFDPSRAHPPAGLQGFYASQRFQGRPSETEHMVQAKRRMAAQRERELRNYHQEQQYNRSLLSEMSGNKSDRSLSPAAMSEDSRRELIARQHRALYGNDSPAFYPPGAFSDDGHSTRGENATGGTPTSATGGVRGASPRGMDPFGADGIGQGATASSSAGGRQSPSRANSTSSPSSGANPSYSLYDSSAEQPVTSTSSPGRADSPSSRQLSSKTTAGPIGSVGPIGSRPSQQTGPSQGPNPALNKRSTTPLPSPLGYGFAPNENANSAVPVNERSTSSASNPASSAHAAGASGKEAPNPVGLGWGSGSGVWGSKNSLGVQASVWG